MVSNQIFDSQYSLVLIKLCLNLCGAITLLRIIYFRRYGDKELVVSAFLFNLFIFSVLVILSNIQFTVSAGFGLFAILALFTLRSEKITKIEIAYFFGSVALAVICSVQGVPLILVVCSTLVILFGAYIADHPKVMSTAATTKVTISPIENYTLSDSQKMKHDLSAQLGFEVLYYQINKIDYRDGSMVVNVCHRKSGA